MNQYNKNLSFLSNAYNQGITGVCLEGSSRSGKTWSGIDFIVKICSEHENLTINIIRETYNSFKTTLYDDFAKRLSMYGIDHPFSRVNDIQTFKMLGNKINFIGADKESKYLGAGCDMFFINESLSVSKKVFDQLEQRCRRFWWMDWNPSCTDHWCFELEKRNDVRFLKTNFNDNPHISANEKKKIKSYEPTTENIKHGTADEYMWKVYGMGERAALEGLIFGDVTYIDEFPELEKVVYGMDFGYTNSPSTIVKVGKEGNNLYLENCFYAPTENVNILQEPLRKIIGVNDRCWADSADPVMIAALQRAGLKVYAAGKPKGSIKAGIDFIKGHKIHIVKDYQFKREQENYKWKEIGGIKLNEPIDAYNHLWDATRYPCFMELR